MASLITALDNHTSKNFGENGHAEYTWSNNIREKIAQFNFQLTRTDEKGVRKLAVVLNELLHFLTARYLNNSSNTELEESKEYLIILYKIIANTRDVIDGKGEYLLTYMMIHTWYDFYPDLAFHAIKCLVDLNDESKTHQYGSWKDIKYFCDYCYKQNLNVNHPLIQYSINIINAQVKLDYANFSSNSDNISLASKWVPRESSGRFGWMYETMACNYFPMYLKSACLSNKETKEKSKSAAILKTKREYRKLLSCLNRAIDTLQIKQCDRTWSEIDFKNVTSISLSKQRKAFLNITKKGLPRYPLVKDRLNCAEHFNAHIEKAIKGEIEIKGKRIGLNDFTKQAMDLNRTSYSSQDEKNVLNSQWRDNSSQNGALGKIIAMVDTSGSMNGDPLHAAIALGIRVAEKSQLGKRIMTFDASPKWVNLEPYEDFCSMVKVIESASWGMNTNFDAALRMILDVIVESKMEPEDVEDLTLAIFSDMQMDLADNSNTNDVLYNRIKEKYAEAGIRVKGRPYSPPHILFWNLRSNSGFPTLSTHANASMMSGFSPTILNLFCELGVESLQKNTPWSIFVKTLESERYLPMETKARKIFNKY